MRGRRDPRPARFYAIDGGARIRPDHPLRPAKGAVGRVLAGLSDRFDAAYREAGRPGVPPGRRIKALLLMAPYSVRSERQLVGRADADLPFRWLLGMSPQEPTCDATAFAPNRPRLGAHGPTAAFFRAVPRGALAAGPCGEHFSADGTRIEGYASPKSVRPTDGPKGREGPPPPAGGHGLKPRNPDVDFRGQKRTNAPHRNATDPEARLYRKSPGPQARLRHLGHARGENRHGPIAGVAPAEASGTAERQAAVDLIDGFRDVAGWGPATVGLDKGYDWGERSPDPEARGVEPTGSARDAARSRGKGSGGPSRSPAWPGAGRPGGGRFGSCGKSGRRPSTWSGCGPCPRPREARAPEGPPPAGAMGDWVRAQRRSPTGTPGKRSGFAAPC